MHGFVYLWENLHPEAKKHKKYIGQHAGAVDDGYIGSGVIFVKRFYCKKYRGHWKRQILEVCETQADLDLAEERWIDRYDAVNSDEFCNYRHGGVRGKHGPFTIKKIVKNCQNRTPWNKGKETGPQPQQTIQTRIDSIKSTCGKKYSAEREKIIQHLNSVGYIKKMEVASIIGRGSQLVCLRHIKSLLKQGIVHRRYFGCNDIRYVKPDLMPEDLIVDFVNKTQHCTVNDIHDMLTGIFHTKIQIAKTLCLKLKKQERIFQYRGYRKNCFVSYKALIPVNATIT